MQHADFIYIPKNADFGCQTGAFEWTMIKKIHERPVGSKSKQLLRMMASKGMDVNIFLQTWLINFYVFPRMEDINF